jgi:hypothetical protein
MLVDGPNRASRLPTATGSLEGVKDEESPCAGETDKEGEDKVER